MTNLAAMVLVLVDIQEQEWNVAGKMRQQMEDTNRFSKGAKVSQQRLLEIRGYLIYALHAYAWLAPYMKGMHNTIDRWRFNRNSNNWKLRGMHLQAMLEERFRVLELCRDDNVENAGVVKV